MSIWTIKDQGVSTVTPADANSPAISLDHIKLVLLENAGSRVTNLPVEEKERLIENTRGFYSFFPIKTKLLHMLLLIHDFSNL